MPNITTAEVFGESRALLNDVANAKYSNTVLLPYLKRAYEDLQQEFILNEINTLISISAPTTITAGTTVLDLTDESEIIHVEEKGPSDVEYSDMYPVDWIPALRPGPFLVYYSWIGIDTTAVPTAYQLRFVGATQDRVIRVYSFRQLPEPADGNTLLHNSKPYLAARTAFYAATYIDQDFSRARTLDADASRALDKIVRIAVKGQQGITTRQMGYGSGLPTNSLLPWRS
jgi:hypothetical protein